MDNASKKNDPLDELIAERKWKPALKLIENRQKKGDKSDGLLAKRIVVLSESPDPSRRLLGSKELNDLAERKPPITDLQALKTLDIFLSKYPQHNPLILQIWERAASTQGQDEEFLSILFQIHFEEERYAAAQKVRMLSHPPGSIRANRHVTAKTAMVWQKNHQQQRTPFFLYILCCYIVSNAPGVSDKDKTLCQMLSYKFLSKAAAEVPTAKDGEDPDSPKRALNTSEDLLLLVRVYKSQNKDTEALALLEDQRTGFGSHLCKKDWEIVRQMIELYTLCKRWQSLYDVCREILQCSLARILIPDQEPSQWDFGPLGDDWVVWDGLLTASVELAKTSSAPGGDSIIQQTDDLLDNFCTKSSSRNARLAALKASCVQGGDVKIGAVAFQYFLAYSARVTCFRDLRPYLPFLSSKAQEVILSGAMRIAQSRRVPSQSLEPDKLSWITSEINALKLEYHLVISRDDRISLVDLLPSFVCNCLRLYIVSIQFDFKLPPSDRLPGDDAAILAAMALMRMQKLGYQVPSFRKSLLRMVFILEFALSKSKHNYDILLILVRLYTYLGAGSLAMERYSQMNIKNLQHVTLSWVLFTRISTIHPYPVTVSPNGTEELTIDPLNEAISALNWHTNAYGLNLKSIRQLQKNNSWTMQLDALSTKSALQDGFARLSLLVESFHMRRLRYPDGSHTYDDKLLRLPEKTRETRDKTAFPNYEASGQLTFEESLPSPDAPRVETNDRWLADSLRQAKLWNHLCGNENNLDVESFQKLERRSESQDDARTLGEMVLSDFCVFIDCLVIAINDAAKKSTWQGHPLMAASTALQQLAITMDNASETSLDFGRKNKAERLKHPDWSCFHWTFSRLEFCLYFKKMSDYMLDCEKKSGLEYPVPLKGALAKAVLSSKKLARKVWTEATDSRADVARRQFLDTFESITTGKDDIERELAKMANDSVNAQKIRKMLQESWLDAWDGVIRTKVV